MSDRRPRSLRWLWQCLLWGGYAALSAAMMVAFAGHHSGGYFIAVMLGLGLWASSEILRKLALQHDWLARPLAGLLWRMALAIALLAALVQVLVIVPLVVGLTLGWLQLTGSDFSPWALLAYWFNTMMPMWLWAAAWLSLQAIRRSRQSELLRLRAEAERSQLEFAALRARLNPHFVFNALNNLRALINEDTERARQMVTQLSNTLRHALGHSTAEMVTLAEELAVVQDYLAIEAVHFEQRLRVEQQIEAEALTALLPPMSLQLLVENAIKHGIALQPQGGTLQIQGGLIDGRLWLAVRNPGRLDRSGSGHGVGLAYLRSRLQALGELAAFSLDAQDGHVLARIEIPPCAP